MEVLSNKQIYVLLKILNDKKLQDGSASYVEFDRNFNLIDFEHIQQQISLIETEPSRQVITIEQTYMKFIGNDIPSGYKVFVSNLDIINEYVNKYIEALIGECLTGLTQENNLATLLGEFYSHSKKSVSIEDYVVNDIKYMPVVLFAYVNNWVELKTLSVRKYDLRKEICGDVLFEKLNLRDDEIMIRMNMTKLVDILKCCGEGKEVIKYIFENATIINTEKIKKQSKKVPNVRKSIYHLQPKQWKLFFCLLKVAMENNKKIDVAEISKEHLIRNGALADSKNAQDTAKTRFNDIYNKIKSNKKGEYEDLIYPKVSDIRYYEFNISKVVNFHNIMKNNEYLSEEYKKHEYFYAQIRS